MEYALDRRDEAIQAWVIGHDDPWTPKFVVIGTRVDAIEKCREFPGSYVGPVPFSIAIKA